MHRQAHASIRAAPLDERYEMIRNDYLFERHT